MRWTWILLLLVGRVLAQSPLPILFVHGLTGDDRSFGEVMEFLTSDTSGPDWGEGINVFDVVLNADNDESTTYYADDVRWQDFQSGSRWINVGRRSFAWEVDDFVDGWVPSDIFAVNFAEERIRGAAGFWNDYFDFSNAAATYKQGYALSRVIQEILDETAAPAVILAGHSMGGLAIREYLQRRENGLPRWWVEPGQPNGHRVAAVLTVGTPHLGSNFVNVGRTEEGESTREVFPPNTGTDAVRDLRYGYLPSGWAPDPDQDNGVYLFGGSESWLAALDLLDPALSYHTYDVNCDGDELDQIVGINSPIEANRDNPAMPLPDDIHYTFLTAIWQGWLGDGDGVVRRDRMFLVDRGDTLLMQGSFHTSLPENVSDVLRGLDEPDQASRAYPLSLPFECEGFLSTQMNQQPIDLDFFQVELSAPGTLEITLEGGQTAVQNLSLWTDTVLIAAVATEDASAVLQIHLAAGVYQICVGGDGSQASWQESYTLSGTMQPDPLAAPVLSVIHLPAEESIQLNWTASPGAVAYEVYELLAPAEELTENNRLLSTGGNVRVCTIPAVENAIRFYCVKAVGN